MLGAPDFMVFIPRMSPGFRGIFHGKMVDFPKCSPIPRVPGLVNIQKTMERSTIFNGKIHYFDWVIFNSYVKLPEGRLGDV